MADTVTKKHQALSERETVFHARVEDFRNQLEADLEALHVEVANQHADQVLKLLEQIGSIDEAKFNPAHMGELERRVTAQVNLITEKMAEEYEAKAKAIKEQLEATGRLGV
jgi:hypothetical protein